MIAASPLRTAARHRVESTKGNAGVSSERRRVSRASAPIGHSSMTNIAAVARNSGARPPMARVTE